MEIFKARRVGRTPIPLPLQPQLFTIRVDSEGAKKDRSEGRLEGY